MEEEQEERKPLEQLVKETEAMTSLERKLYRSMLAR